ncbi:transcriptional regulator, ArsR family protein [Alkalihalophilus pseudofirmus OF4]|uniref:Transcriptional regulator, ArsR family protein n=1 Tax=Alkalihalophilus pseudofirmus (strain ATCC BAA-2126 / JCM 17055 / OF4) TaxID=398511 RepID=D3FQ66_ALKPO|nr:metalloregulator ArsR/SmtB family transcription factor [Alkalihalophilus pseudofirmus]ADC51359.1 transcriptional regulator, ArsR family protein [Alkalihalophilus pseudofirmus OF4]
MNASSNDSCEIYSYDAEKVTRLKKGLEKEELGGVAQLFKAIVDVNRAKITYSLCEEEELCVCDIANIIGSSVATASHHLRTLHKQGVVKYRKEGKLAFYSLDDHHIKQLLLIALEHKKEGKAHD